MTKQISGGALLVKCLMAEGVDIAYGVPGESYLAVLDALYDAQNRIRMIGARHEGGAAFMAEAYGKLTGKPGICFVTRGPGATNASIGVHTARQNSTPMILFVGQIGRDMRDREAFQEVDYRAMFGTIAKWVTEIDNAARIPELIARAFKTARSGRPGPVVVALPEDMLREMTNAEPVASQPLAEAAPNRQALDQLRERLAAAQRPVLLIGGGGWNARGKTALANFVARHPMPVFTAFRFQDLIDNASPAYCGDAGVGMAPYVKKSLAEADLVIALNIRFGESTTDGWQLFAVPKLAASLIHVHADDAELGKIYQADLAVQSGPNEIAQALDELPVEGAWPDWQATCRAGLFAMRQSAFQSGAVNMIEICAYLDETLADNAVLTNGAGNFAIWPSKFITYRDQRRLLGPQSGAMGAGIPAAIAAKSVDPSRQVVCFAGDGDFQMTMAELGTAAQEGLGPVILILNNGTYGTIRAHQERDYPGRISATRLENPDFVAIAKAYRMFAARIEDTGMFQTAFAEALKSPSGAVLDIKIAEADISPFQQLKLK